MAEVTANRSGSLSRRQGFIGCTTLVVILATTLAYGAIEPAYWLLLTASIIVMFMVQLLLGLQRGVPDTAYKIKVPALLYSGALAWALAQTLPGLPAAWSHSLWSLVPDATPYVSANPISGYHATLRLAAYAMVFWIAVNAATNPSRAHMFLKIFAIFSTGLAVFGLVAAITGVNPILGPAATSSVSASFINRNSYATFAIFGMVTNLAIYLRLVRNRIEDEGRNGRELRAFIEGFFSGAWLYGFGALLCLSAILLSGSRAGTASGIAAVLTLVLCFQRNLRRSTAVWLTFVIVFGAFATALSEIVLTRLAQIDGDARFLIYPHIVNGILERPLLGHGLGAFHDTFRARVPLEAAGAEWDLAHSTFLENAYELGLPAAAAFYGALAWISVVILRGTIVRKRHRVFPATALACIVGAGLHSMVDFSLQMPATAAVFAFVVGIGWAHSWPRSGARIRGSDERPYRS